MNHFFFEKNVYFRGGNLTRNDAMNKRSEKGFTLLEILVVGIIVSILAAVAVPRMGFRFSKNRLRSSTSSVTSMLYLARMKAVKRSFLRRSAERSAVRIVFSISWPARPRGRRHPAHRLRPLATGPRPPPPPRSPRAQAPRARAPAPSLRPRPGRLRPPRRCRRRPRSCDARRPRRLRPREKPNFRPRPCRCSVLNRANEGAEAPLVSAHRADATTCRAGSMSQFVLAVIIQQT